jgi:hypothetical protein
MVNLSWAPRTVPSAPDCEHMQEAKHFDAAVASGRNQVDPDTVLSGALSVVPPREPWALDPYPRSRSIDLRPC